MGKRVPELSSIIDAFILTNKIELLREYPFACKSKKDYQCPICQKIFKVYQINDSRKRRYIRHSSQARRHYKRATCINRFKLVNKGYLRNDRSEKRGSKYQPFQGKPTLTNAVQYLLGLGRYQTNSLQLITYGLMNNTITLKPTYEFYNPDLCTRIHMNHLVSDENTRAISIPNLTVDVNGNIQEVNMDMPKFEQRKDIEDFVINRLKIMATYFRAAEFMRYMPSIWNSETLRPVQKELNVDMLNYLNIIDPNGTTTPDTRQIGLLTQ
jgi:hypothetical protein